MALRNQPYIPLYVQDYLTDEKLNMCSAASQGVYIKIMCILHKQATYGELVLFKQRLKQEFKQNPSMTEKFAYILTRLLTFTYEEILEALEELVAEGVLIIDGDRLLQPRMVKDNARSEARSAAGKKGGGNPNLFKQDPKQGFKQKVKQNPEYENEYEYTNEDVVKGGMGESAEPQKTGEQKPDPEYSVEFEMWWNLYDKKVGDKKKLMAKWRKIPKRDIGEIFKHTKDYVRATPDKKFRKNPQTYLNNESWNDEIIESNGKTNRTDNDNEELGQRLAETAIRLEYERYDNGEQTAEEFERRIGFKPVQRHLRNA